MLVISLKSMRGRLKAAKGGKKEEERARKLPFLFNYDVAEHRL